MAAGTPARDAYPEEAVEAGCEAVLGDEEQEASEDSEPPSSADETGDDSTARQPGHGRRSADDYLLKRWDSLTLFLRKSGAPLDNNICERALKKSILHRRNSMFYKSRNGARTGDMYMSLIYTCELSGANAFDYLNQLQLHTEAVK